MKFSGCINFLLIFILLIIFFCLIAVVCDNSNFKEKSKINKTETLMFGYDKENIIKLPLIIN